MNIEEFKKWAKLKCMALVVEMNYCYTFISNTGTVFTVETNEDGVIQNAYNGELAASSFYEDEDELDEEDIARCVIEK